MLAGHCKILREGQNNGVPVSRLSYPQRRSEHVKAILDDVGMGTQRDDRSRGNMLHALTSKISRLQYVFV